MSEKNSKNSTPNSTKSKPSTGSDINTKSDTGARRWVRLGNVQSELFEINHLLDLYWGGSERRLTGLTIRIIAVNAMALLTLMIGIMYLGQYQERLIETRLETFEAELDLVGLALSENINETDRIDYKSTPSLVERLGEALDQNIFVFDQNGQLIAEHSFTPPQKTESLRSITVLKSLGKAVLELMNNKETFPPYPQNAQPLPDVQDALSKEISVSIWQGQENRFLISAARPILDKNKQTLLGAVLMTREATEIEREIARVWGDVLRIFTITLILTTILSIYLSGVIARPLKKLARAAEAVRKGQATAEDIPDLSARHDEIGELSLVLKQMTHALWNKMDANERFAADVAHELKNPLTSLRSAIETLAIVKKKQDREKLMGVITHDLERLDRLITDISSASRLDSELSREVFQTLSLKTMLATLMDGYKDPLERDQNRGNAWDNEARSNGVRIILKTNIMHDISVSGVQSRLMQVFENILSNALSFSPKGSEITILVHEQAKTASITFEDRGPGIPENKLDHVFDRFYSERPEHEDYGRHSGLGLSICKQILDAHSGDIHAENIKNKQGETTGARFTVILKKA